MKETGKYSFGIGDRFSHQGKAQLEALMKASETFGIKITPVWNKQPSHCPSLCTLTYHK